MAVSFPAGVTASVDPVDGGMIFYKQKAIQISVR
jgi:hypothetical protein